MQPQLYIFKQRHELYHHLANQIKSTAEVAPTTTIALSGGNTQRDFYKYIVQADLAAHIPWSAYQIYWGDERCVPHDHPESNYGMAFEHLFKRINSPENNIYRIRGENDPVQEALRYTNLIKSKITDNLNDVPRFDWLLMGIGEDGHTASLFPGQSADGLCIVARHPVSGQYRVSMNYELINSARRVSFVVTGSAKAPIVASILSGKSAARDLPAARILPADGILEWYLDGDATSRL
jgi:6-phosphogluconolactonase